MLIPFSLSPDPLRCSAAYLLYTPSPTADHAADDVTSHTVHSSQVPDEPLQLTLVSHGLALPGFALMQSGRKDDARNCRPKSQHVVLVPIDADCRMYDIAASSKGATISSALKRLTAHSTSIGFDLSA